MEIKYMIILIKALNYAAISHQNQRRNGSKIPYINHPIKVCQLLSKIGNIQNEIILCSALLHDIIEDTDITVTQLENTFGCEIANLVLEVSDDKSLPKKERKQLQILHAPLLSDNARVLKLADKIANMQDILHNPPDWSVERKIEYFDWAKRVFDAGLSGINSQLEVLFCDVYYQKHFL
jgi:guanosine-3',5'-bis(diphosphate) 3'-pyrophosphohydrolase